MGSHRRRHYAFDGVPASIGAGRVSLLLHNPSDSRDLHEIVVVRRLDGVAESFGEILQLPDHELGTRLDAVGATSAPPGAHGATWVDLAPGAYALVCPIPRARPTPARNPADHPTSCSARWPSSPSSDRAVEPPAGVRQHVRLRPMRPIGAIPHRGHGAGLHDTSTTTKASST